MIESPKNLTEQLLNLVERLATVLRAQLATINEKLGKEEAQTTYVPRTEVGSLQGPKGDAGPYYSPTVSVDGVLSWTNTGNLANPDPINIKGPQGERGPAGADGAQGPAGADGAQGHKGDPGPAGADGAQGPKGDTGAVFTPAVDAAGNLSWTNNGGLSNPASVNIKGPKGEKGDKGEKGEKGDKGLQGDPGTTTWAGITDKPSTFPPSAHSHTTADVTGLDTALAAKANATDLTSLIPRINSRGALAGYETPFVQDADTLTINRSAQDSNLVTGATAITVSNGATSQSWTKTVAISNASATISLGSEWKWVGGTAPSVSANCVVVFHWCSNFGIANLVATS